MKRQIGLLILLISLTFLAAACGGGGGGGDSGDTGGGDNTTVSGTVTISSTANAAQGLFATGAGQPLSDANVELYNADKPEWLYPIAVTLTDGSGNYTLSKLTHAADNGNAYTDGDPLPAGKYTIIAYKYDINTSTFLVAVQAYVKLFDGDITGNNVEAASNTQIPEIASMFGIVEPNPDGTYGSNTFEIAQNGAVQVTFTMPMARMSALDAITLKDESSATVGGIWKVSADLLSATFYPTNDLTVNGVYTVTVTTDAKNVYGKAIPAAVTGTFLCVEADTTPPNAELFTPKDQTGVPINTMIKIASNEVLDVNTFTVASTPSIGDKPAILYSGMEGPTTKPYVYKIVPNGLLTAGTDYAITVSGAKDLAGNTLTTATFNFKSGTGEDNTAPVSTASPAGGLYNSSQTVSLSADESVSIYYTTDGSAPTTSSLMCIPGSSSIPCSIAISATTTLQFFAVDDCGNTETAHSEVYELDAQAPSVSTKSPIDGATNVSVTDNVTATFSEDMNASTITAPGTFTLGGVPGAVTYNSSTKTATFNPTDNLNYGTTYTALISTAAEDLSGNPLSSSVSWSFTTIKIAPTNFTATGGYSASQVSLSWDAMSGATAYKIYWKKDATGVTTADSTISESSNSYIHQPIEPTDGMYCYKVAAVYPAGDSGLSSEQCATITINPPPPPPAPKFKF